MTRIAMLRHAPTSWNRSGKLQGRTDIRLGVEGEAEACGWRLPAELQNWVWLTSPLKRTRETAEILFAGESVIDPRLTETDWGEWEGMKLADLRQTWGDGVGREGRAGLDFSAPGGESPRDVQARLQPLLKEIGRLGQETVMITHKGVIRATYALATGWDMMCKPPEKIRNQLHFFRVDGGGGLRVDQLNVEITDRL